MIVAIEIWFAYLGTIIVFMATPGPSHLLMLATTLSDGFPRSLATAAGDLSANALQITVAGAGLFSVLATVGQGFFWLKWAGVVYLLWLGARLMINAGARATITLSPASISRLWFRGFATSAGNPKAIVFFAALFPQFLDPASALWPQIVVFGVTYLVVDGLFLTTYGIAGTRLASWLGRAGRSWLERLAGAFMVVTAVWLGARAGDS